MRRLVLFDLDDTLVDRGAAFRAWAEEFADGYRLGEGALGWLIAEDRRIKGPQGPYFAAVRRRFGLAASVDALWAQYRARMPELARCRAEDGEALVRLRAAGWRIGIVTNGMTDNQLGKIRRTGLDELVDGWCISEEVGIRKPDPAIFRLAARRCGEAAAEGGWMVGDRLDQDVAGGHAAGLRTVWVSGDAAPGSTLPVADFVAESVADAVEVVLGAEPAT